MPKRMLFSRTWIPTLCRKRLRFPDYGCGLENYVRSKVGLIGVCVELSRGDKTRFQHPDNQFNKEVWERAWQLPYLYVENAVIYGSRIEENARLYMGN